VVFYCYDKKRCLVPATLALWAGPELIKKEIILRKFGVEGSIPNLVSRGPYQISTRSVNSLKAETRGKTEVRKNGFSFVLWIKVSNWLRVTANHEILVLYIRNCRSQWPRGLKRRSSAARLLGLRVRIPPKSWMPVSCECCVLSSRGLCDGPITHPEDSYRL
jgi:hypothetical protein